MIRETDIKTLINIQEILITKNENQLINYKSLLNDDILFLPNIEYEFDYCSNILIHYGLALKVDSLKSDGLLYINSTSKTFIVKIKDIYEHEKKEQEKSDLNHELNKYNLKQIKWFLKTKWLPLIISIISLIYSVISTCTSLKNYLFF